VRVIVTRPIDVRAYDARLSSVAGSSYRAAMLRTSSLLLVAPLLSLACSEDGRRADSGSAGASAGSITLTAAADDTEAAMTSAGASSDDGAGAEAGSGGSPGSKFDLGPTPDAGEVMQPEACVKVDLLFVIDNSSSMKDEQDNLVASFPGFVESMQQQLAGADSYHVGVVSTDKYDYNEDPCHGILGGLVTRTGGSNSSKQLCGPYASGARYMSEADDLGPRFACAAQVGTAGDSDERPLDAGLRALGPDLNARGACNDGFLRKDALLVLVIITDEEEEGSGGQPQDWFDGLVALKDGVESNVVVLSLIGPEDPSCAMAAEVGHRIIEFTEKFTYGSIGQICAATYNLFFSEAIAVISEACENYTPPG
jgi:hypothetical protein